MIIKILFFISIFIAISNSRKPSMLIKVSEIMPGDFPYMVTIQNQNFHICNGAIISSQHILTAAHCFVKCDSLCISKLIVIFGATENYETRKIHKVHEVISHSNFSDDQKHQRIHDIAVITLSDKIVFDYSQNAIALPNKNAPGDIVGILLSWRNTSSRGEKSACLKETKVSVLTNKECNEEYPRIMATQMCGINGKGTGFCDDDSGSPLVYNNEVIGIASYSSCNPGFPKIYTRVYQYINFLTGIITANSTN